MDAQRPTWITPDKGTHGSWLSTMAARSNAVAMKYAPLHNTRKGHRSTRLGD